MTWATRVGERARNIIGGRSGYAGRPDPADTGGLFPGAPVAPHMDSGYTESQMYREIGIESYGFTPYLTTPEENHTEHGDNERIRVEEVRRGPRVLYDVVATVAGAQ